MEILCTLYELPEHLIDKQTGAEQYSKLEDMVDSTEGMKELLVKLEDRYDSEQQEESLHISDLSDDIESFLKDVQEDL